MIHATYAEWFSATRSESNHIFHVSLPCYALVEAKPRPGKPNWAEVASYQPKKGGEGMLAYLSLVDAALDQHTFNLDGPQYRIMPFEVIDPRAFLQQHDNWFTVYVVYGFAARGNRLVTTETGALQVLTQVKHFHITPDIVSHFQLDFGEQAVAWLNKVHRAAGLPDYPRMVEELGECSVAEIEQHAKDAMRKIGPSIVDKQNISHCALYDTVEGRWRFAAFEDLS